MVEGELTNDGSGGGFGDAEFCLEGMAYAPAILVVIEFCDRFLKKGTASQFSTKSVFFI